jgi:predicted aspartyl protease
MSNYLPMTKVMIIVIITTFFSIDVFGSDKIHTDKELPILVSDNRLIVEIEIQGLGKQHFIIDMAASGSVISPTLKDQIDLNPSDIKIDTVRGASGYRLMEFIKLPEVNFAGFPFSGIDAVVFESGIFKEYEGKNVQGILGVDVLQNFDLSLNLKDHTIKISPINAENNNVETESGSISFQSRAMPGFVEFEITVNGKKMNAFFDTGGKQSIINWKAAEILGIDKHNSSLRVKENGTRGIDGGKEETFLYTFEELRIGPATLKENEVKIANLPVFDHMGYGDTPVILIGIDFLKECTVDIKYSSNTILLCRN